MSNQELKNQIGKKEDDAVNQRRRFIKGAGIAAPVVLTLASGPVFGAQCFSGLQSSNLSHHNHDHCWGGQSPGFWKNYYTGNPNNGTLNPGVSCFGDSKTTCWNTTGWSYGSWNHDDTKIGLDGTLLSATPLSALFSDSRTLSRILLEENGTCLWHAVAVMLNTYYGQNKQPPYLLTPAQFVGLISGATPVPPGYTDGLDFICRFAATQYHDLPGNEMCPIVE